MHILRRVYGDENWSLEIGHYTPDGEWEGLRLFHVDEYDDAAAHLNELNGGLIALKPVLDKIAVIMEGSEPL